MTSEPEDQVCALCGLPESEHVNGKLNHQFSLDGSLTVKPMVRTADRAEAAVLKRLINQLVYRKVLTEHDVIQVLFPGINPPSPPND